MTDSPSARVAVAIMAKAPMAGEVKTRLCPPLSPLEASELYQCFLLDKIAQLRAIASARPVIAFTPEGGRGVFERMASGFELIAQRGPDLGSRLLNVLSTLLANGYRGAVAIDSDTPTLPSEFLLQAIDVVADPAIDLVLGPTDDGGYYLIGMSRPWPVLFHNMPWSTADVLPETIRRAEATGLRVSCLPLWFDVDVPGDLERLRASLTAAGGEAARHTREFLTAHTV
jgi:rSAM/selenodomain-associated transferase 1